ncbi:MAG: flagellar basal body-associated FliL family protein [Pseudomonadota bacterium]
MAKLLPLIIALFGAGAGLGAGHMLASTHAPGSQPASADEVSAKTSDSDHSAKKSLPKEIEEDDSDFVRLNNQFVVPIVEKERVASLIVVSLALETAPGSTDFVFEREPKLRDEFLTVLFAHARSGGFTGSFTDEHLMGDLRGSLLEAAQGVLGTKIRKVLLNEVVRQDL